MREMHKAETAFDWHSWVARNASDPCCHTAVGATLSCGWPQGFITSFLFAPCCRDSLTKTSSDCSFNKWALPKSTFLKNTHCKKNTFFSWSAAFSISDFTLISWCVLSLTLLFSPMTFTCVSLSILPLIVLTCSLLPSWQIVLGCVRNCPFSLYKGYSTLFCSGVRILSEHRYSLFRPLNVSHNASLK